MVRPVGGPPPLPPEFSQVGNSKWNLQLQKAIDQLNLSGIQDRCRMAAKNIIDSIRGQMSLYSDGAAYQQAVKDLKQVSDMTFDGSASDAIALIQKAMKELGQVGPLKPVPNPPTYATWNQKLLEITALFSASDGSMDDPKFAKAETDLWYVMGQLTDRSGVDDQARNALGILGKVQWYLFPSPPDFPSALPHIDHAILALGGGISPLDPKNPTA